MKEKIRVGICFATGRKYFRRILRSHVYNWQESGLINNGDISINLLVAFDTTYQHTTRIDYSPLTAEISQMLDSAYFIGKKEVEAAKQELVSQGTLTYKETSMLFGKGYAAQRNILLYYALKNKMDYILYLDDDEYPVAVTPTKTTAIWQGQHVLRTHLENIGTADITYGHHCGYVSPIPMITFSDTFKKSDFSLFIGAISNDIINWKSIERIMEDGGVTYADANILSEGTVSEVEEVNHAKFISGSNLCINLKKPERIFPFFNPPNARGEDTFLSTCLSHQRVLRVPCYTFHDGFATHNHILSGVLPTHFSLIEPDSEKIVRRFYAACLGWIRYKPLLLYILDRNNYEEKIKKMTSDLITTLPLICQYFHNDDFMNILKELAKYDKVVEKHYNDFLETQRIWAKVMATFL